MKFRRMLAMVTFGALAACGSDNPGPVGVNPNNTMTAVIDAGVFEAATVSALRTPARVYISGTRGARTLTISVDLPSAPGTMTLPSDDPTNNVLISEGAGINNAVWSSSDAPLANSSFNSITFTAISATAAEGTFSLQAFPSAGTPATGTRTVMVGTFSVVFQ